MNLKIKNFHCWLDLLPSSLYKQIQKLKQTIHVSEDSVEVCKI